MCARAHGVVVPCVQSRPLCPMCRQEWNFKSEAVTEDVDAAENVAEDVAGDMGEDVAGDMGEDVAVE